MVRPLKPRRVSGCPQVFYFKPQGIPLRMLEEVVLMSDEFEAISLYTVDNLDQTVAAEKMGISQPTFARILQRAYKKIAQALVYGKAIRIESTLTE
ncbi:MAG: DUF134 domain-containing protein [bacterium]